jgi:hypothetical protein
MGNGEENSIVFDGENGTMKISGGPNSLFAMELKPLIKFWVEERKDTHAAGTRVRRRIAVTVPVCRGEVEHGSYSHPTIWQEIKLEAEERGDSFPELRGLGCPDLLQSAHTLLFIGDGALHVLHFELNALQRANRFLNCAIIRQLKPSKLR